MRHLQSYVPPNKRTLPECHICMEQPSTKMSCCLLDSTSVCDECYLNIVDGKCLACGKGIYVDYLKIKNFLLHKYMVSIMNFLHL